MKLPDFKSGLPKLKLPSRSKGSKAGKTGISAPGPVADLYADLRDRRLLPLVALLVVAIAAVPFLLGGDDGEEAMPAPAAVAGGTQAQQAGFTVVPEEATLRDYRKRLGYREPRDPFDQTSGAAPAAEVAEVPAAPASGGGSIEEEPSFEPAIPESPAPVPVEPSGDETTTRETTTGVVVEKELKRWVIDINAGFVERKGDARVVEDLKKREGLSPVTELPNPDNPAVAFVGLSGGQEGALFLMTSQVSAYYGKGRCVVDKASCQMLELTPGKSAIFKIGYGDTRYKVTLEKIEPVYNTRADESSITRDSHGD